MDVNSGQSVIQIQKKEHFWTKGVIFKVFIDGKIVGTVGTNPIEEFLVEPGQHQVSVKMGWSKSNTITILSDLGETSTLICKCNEPVINFLLAIVFMQFFTTNILKPFHLGALMEKRIDFYTFITVSIVTVISTILPSVLAQIKIIALKNKVKV